MHEVLQNQFYPKPKYQFKKTMYIVIVKKTPKQAKNDYNVNIKTNEINIPSFSDILH